MASGAFRRAPKGFCDLPEVPDVPDRRADAIRALLGGADGSLARVRAPVVLGGDGSLLNRRRRLRGGARLDPAKVLLRALRLLFVEGVLERLRGDGASLVEDASRTSKAPSEGLAFAIRQSGSSETNKPLLSA